MSQKHKIELKNFIVIRAKIRPNYNKVPEAKQMWRPDSVEHCELCAQTYLQKFLGYTVKCTLGHNPLNNTLQLKSNNIELLFSFKIGFDGAGSFKAFMQRTESGQVPEVKFILLSQLVLLQIVLKDIPDIIFYKNCCPNSANSYQPIRIAYEKENKETINQEAPRQINELKNLQSSVFSEDSKISTYKGLFMMIDGKILKELTNAPASSSCLNCHKTYRQIA